MSTDHSPSPDRDGDRPARRSGPSLTDGGRRMAAALDRASPAVVSVVTAAATATAAALVVVAGFRLHPLLLLVLWVGWTAVLTAFNRHVLATVKGQYGRPHLPGRRMVCAGVLGLLVATPFTLLVLAPQVGALAQETRTPGAPGPAQPRDEAELQSTVAAPVPQVEDDGEVTRLRGQVTVVQDDLRAADQQLVCEKDGTCGSGREGEGTNYKSKREARDRIQSQLDDVEDELATARKAAEDRNGDLVRRRGEAQARLAALRTTRAAAVQGVAAGASLTERLRAVWAVGYRSPALTAVVPFAGIGLYALIDLGLLMLVVRRRVRPSDLRRLSWRQDGPADPGTTGPSEPWPPPDYPLAPPSGSRS